jgi:hypothetical protein
MNTYLQRADDFILQQMHRFEQKKQGRDYREMQNSPHHDHQRTTRARTFNSMSPTSPSVPRGWLQEYDPQSQRWYYIDRSTGRSQWEPPSSSMSDYKQPRDRDGDIARRLQGVEDARARNCGRASSHMQQPRSGHLSTPQQQRPLSTSPHPSPHGRLPPGAHLDMRTGQVVTNMFPPDHPMNSN